MWGTWVTGLNEAPSRFEGGVFVGGLMSRGGALLLGLLAHHLVD